MFGWLRMTDTSPSFPSFPSFAVCPRRPRRLDPLFPSGPTASVPAASLKIGQLYTHRTKMC